MKSQRVGRFLNRFDNERRLFRSWLASPKAIGAIAPSGETLSRAMADHCDPTANLPTLELGAGTGAITRCILEKGLAPEMLHSLEFSHGLIGGLRTVFPKVKFIEDDAFRFASDCAVLGRPSYDCVISSLPLLNFPPVKRRRLILDLLNCIPPGRPFVQFSYGALSPVPPVQGQCTVDASAWIMRNLPPARIWVYRKTTN